jgi:hypothetical protein
VESLLARLNEKSLEIDSVLARAKESLESCTQTQDTLRSEFRSDQSEWAKEVRAETAELIANLRAEIEASVRDREKAKAEHSSWFTQLRESTQTDADATLATLKDSVDSAAVWTEQLHAPAAESATARPSVELEQREWVTELRTFIRSQADDSLAELKQMAAESREIRDDFATLRSELEAQNSDCLEHLHAFAKSEADRFATALNAILEQAAKTHRAAETGQSDWICRARESFRGDAEALVAGLKEMFDEATERRAKSETEHTGWRSSGNRRQSSWRPKFRGGKRSGRRIGNPSKVRPTR